MARVSHLPGRILTTTTGFTRRMVRQTLGTASLERAVAGKVVVFTGASTQVEQDAVAALRAAGAEVVVGKVGDSDAAAGFAEKTLGRHDAVDVLVNGTHDLPVSDDPGRAMQAGYFSPVRLTLAFLPGMRARRSGHILNLHDSVPRTEKPAEAIRLSAHAALSSFSRCIAAEVLHDRVVVTAYALPREPGERAAADLCDAIATRPRRAGRP